MRMTGLILLTLTLTACQRDPAAPTAEENRQLDEAANLLDEAPANLEAIDDGGLVGTNGVAEVAPEGPH
jgi:hypothetical protein